AHGSGASGICVRADACACDKGVILPAALRAPKSSSKTDRYVLVPTSHYQIVLVIPQPPPSPPRS
ncbi:hypothetical protein, partial [Paraburkholderia nemoris]|uniref:hypothetical protein n=1 Tax=Paraburkholderia nemoris TaxID=2793076 RepID=UPI0038BE0944